MRDRAAVGTVVVAHPSAELSGSAALTLETIEGLTERGWQVLLAVPGDGPFLREARRAGAATVVLDAPVLGRHLLRPRPFLRIAVASMVGAVRIAALLRSVRPAAVYVATIRIPLWILVGCVLRIPVVCHIHERELRAPRVIRAVLGAPVGFATQVLVNSRHGSAVLIETVPRLAHRVVALDTRVAGPDPVVPPRDRIDGAFRLVYAGCVSPRTGVDIAVEALGLLIEEGIDARLEVVGEASPDDEWFLESLERRVAELGLQTRVQFAGLRSDVWSALSDADMALIPSRGEEPLNDAAVEAVLSGRPVAVSAIGGLAEAVDGFASAIPVIPADPAELAAAIRRVRSNWAAFRRTAIAMAPIAASRYSSARFREAVEDEVRHAAMHASAQHRPPPPHRAPASPEP